MLGSGIVLADFWASSWHGKAHLSGTGAYSPISSNLMSRSDSASCLGSNQEEIKKWNKFLTG